MKKVISILVIVILFMNISLSSFAKYSDVFYFDSSDSEFQAAVKQFESMINESTLKYIEMHHLKNGKKADINKIFYDTDKIQTFREWKWQELIDFMKAENKETAINSIQPFALQYPVYYDGELLKNFRVSFYYRTLKENPDKKYWDIDGSFFSPEPNQYMRLVFLDKDEILDVMNAQGITGYELIHFVCIDGLFFVIAEKEGKTVAIYLPQNNSMYPGRVVFEGANEEIDYLSDITKELYNCNKSLFEDRFFSVSEIETVAQMYEELRAKHTNDGGAIATGGSGNRQTNSAFSQNLVIICGSGVLILLVALIIIKKKLR